MTPSEQLGLGVWGTTIVVTGMITGVLPGVILLGAIAYGTQKLAVAALHSRALTAQSITVKDLQAGIDAIRINASNVQYAINEMRRLVREDPTPERLACLEQLQEDAKKPQNSTVTADYYAEQLREIRQSGEDEELLRDIRRAAKLIGLGTFFAPVPSLLLLSGTRIVDAIRWNKENKTTPQLSAVAETI